MSEPLMSLAQLDASMRIRAVIAASIIAISMLFTWKQATLPKEWQAVFLIVVGYYFKERTLTASLARIEIRLQYWLAAWLVIGTFLAFYWDASNISEAWIAGTVLAIAFYFKDTPYDDDDGSFDADGIQMFHERARAGLTLLVLILTPCFLIPPLSWWETNTQGAPAHQAQPLAPARTPSPSGKPIKVVSTSKPPISVAASVNKPSDKAKSSAPVISPEWVGIVFVVVAFYFKERTTRSPQSG